MSKENNGWKPRGIYDYDEEKEKKDKKKNPIKLLEKTSKKDAKMANCNHIDRKKGNTHFESIDNGTAQRCKICGAKMFTDPEFMTDERIKDAVDTIMTGFSVFRNRVPMSEKLYRRITGTLENVIVLPKVMDVLRPSTDEALIMSKKDFKKKHKKDKKKKKNKKSKHERKSITG